MKEIVINGGRPLFGSVRVSGSKNGALPIIFATLATPGVSRLDNVPDIGDVRVAISILESFGAVITRSADRLYVDTTDVHYANPSPELISKIRASTYLIGACLARFGRCALSSVGGCNFSNRPIDMHLCAASALGAEVGECEAVARRLHGAEIRFGQPSVGATANALILASSIPERTEIFGGAREPHVIALAEFLTSAGAEITFTHEKIVVNGGRLHAADTRIIGDMIEAGTYLAAGLVTGGEVTVNCAPVADMTTFIDFLVRFGAEIQISGDSITAKMCSRGEKISVVAEPYPGFPTDLQPIAAPLLAFGSGGEIYDLVWRERFGYMSSLCNFGVTSRPLPHGTLIYPSSPTPAVTCAPDLRGGAALILAALAAVGESRISKAEILLRGYEKIEEKFRNIGADFKISDRS